MTTRVIALSLLFAGATAGGALGRHALCASPSETTYSTAPATVRVASLPVTLDEANLPPPPSDGFQVAVEPSRLGHGARGESLELAVAVTNGDKVPAAFRYALEIVDDRGAAVAPTSITKGPALPAGQTGRVTVVTPAGLADGYYAARTTVVLRAGDNFHTDSNTTYLRVAGGEITPIDFTTFHDESRAHEAQ